MRTVYGLRMEIMNGTVVAYSETSVYGCAELRETVKKRMMELNKECNASIRYSEFESLLYEAVGDVPIMRDTSDAQASKIIL